MRELLLEELDAVTGGTGYVPPDDCTCPPEPCKPGKKPKGNNSYGNGGDDGIPNPHNTKFTDKNR